MALAMIAALLVIAAIAIAVLTGREIDGLRKELAVLEQAKRDTLFRLEDLESRRESLEGTRSLLEKVKSELLARQHKMEEQIEELKKEELPEVSVRQPLQKRLDFDEDSGEAS